MAGELEGREIRVLRHCPSTNTTIQPAKKSEKKLQRRPVSPRRGFGLHAGPQLTSDLPKMPMPRQRKGADPGLEIGLCFHQDTPCAQLLAPRNPPSSLGRLGHSRRLDCFKGMAPVRNRRRRRGKVKAVRSVGVRKPSRATSARLAEIEGILLEGIDAGKCGLQQALDKNALNTALQVMDHGKVGATWTKDPRVLLEGIENSEQGKQLAQQRLKILHPPLPGKDRYSQDFEKWLRKVFKKESADGLQPWLTLEFWQKEIDRVLIEGIFGGSEAREEDRKSVV